jgi:translation initiation factor IF-2
VSNPKVFEFAKEIGMTPLALMDKIREWHIPVKSHMAELEPEVLVTIKQKLSEPSTAKAETDSKKTPARKKATAAKSAKAEVEPEAPKKAAGKSTAKAVTKSPVKAGAKAKAKAATAEAQPAKPAGTVVRRKAKTAEELKAEALAAEQETQVDSDLDATGATTETPTPATAVAATEMESVPETSIVAAESSRAAPAVVKPSEEIVPEKKVVARKKEVSIGHSGVESSQNVAIGFKKNIIGRMDLSRVTNQNQSQQRPGPRPQGGAPSSGGMASGVGARPTRPGGNIRAGFVQAAPMPEGIVEDDSRKKEDRRRNKGTAFEGGPAKPAAEGEVQTFDAAEFRKREMVFQPKKKKGMLSRPAMQTQITMPDASKRVVKVYGTMKVGDLAMEMKLKSTDLIKVLMKNGVLANLNTELDFDTISLIAPEFKYEAQMAMKTADDVLVQTAFGELGAEPVTRPPVVTIMGHVDHGKTSLLDTIRNANVAKGEAGGITQHIGAYQVKLDSGQLITFLDTPGHEAFTQMRARGANVTDIAVVVVAADDGVMPQTAEAISHAKAAGVPLIIAVNKMDKPGANPERVKQQLTEYQVVPEEWGGDTIFCPVSALKKTGIKELLEQILLVAEVEDLKANPKRSGTGAVIESRLEKGRGNVATILIHDGTVKVGQFIVAGKVSGRVKSMMTDRGEKVQEAGPGMPVELLGLDGTPAAGDQFDIVKDERSAEEVAKIRKELEIKAINPSSKMSLEDLFSKVKSGDVKELPVILKADVAGSLEAINGMFAKLQSPDVKVKVIHSAVGGVTENDVLLASTAKGIVVGFNVRPDGNAAAVAKRAGVDVRSYTVVYELMDEMKKAMAGLLQPDIVEKVMGRAEVRNTFNVPKIGMIGGCSVVDGKIQRSNLVRLLRDGKIVYQGKIGSLKRFKDDAKEVASGFECGIGIENFNDLKVGDVIEAFIKEEIAKELNLSVTP